MSINTVIHAQFGVTVRYSMDNFDHWSTVTEAINGEELWTNHIEYAVDYWFKPGKRRAEYSLEGKFLRTSTDQISPGGNQRKYNLSGFGIGVKGNYYILDFGSDCQCPTFSKEGNLVKKGLFLQLNGGLTYFRKEAEFFANPKDNSVGLNVGFGVGLDIGVSDMLTITPVVNYVLYPLVSWDRYGLQHGILDQTNPNSTTKINMLQLGVRIGLHPDYLKEQRVLRR